MKPILTGLALGALLVGLLVYTWAGAPDFGWDLSLHGWIAMGIGTLLTIGLAAGLMGLVFYSARRGYDERIPRDDPDA
ncbi:MAG: hypothetical protein JNJ73_06590 [Hyphomonadaceae bacterium]|nr:hypothetical protein [Hyphomonadaceae bacterium]